MRRFHVPGASPTSEVGLSKGERRRLRSMLLGLLLVVAMVVVGWIKGGGLGDDAPDLAPEDGVGMVEQVHLPKIDAARLDRLVSDEGERGRVVLEPQALGLLLGDVRRLTPQSFEALGSRLLDASSADELRANASTHRGQAFHARGTIRSLETRRVGDEELELGLLELEDGGSAWFLALDVPDNGGFVRVEGLFWKNFRAEDRGSPPRWIDAPLLLALRAERSFADLGETTTLDPGALAGVQDDDLVPADGSPPKVSGMPFEALWSLMDFVQDSDLEAIDWESAPELDAEALADLLQDGRPFRGRPFRIPISRLQGVRVKRAGENPARLASSTEGWIGNAAWENVLHFKSPEARYDLALGDYVYGHGFFLKNFAYESASRGLRIAPVIVMADLVEFVPEEDPGVRRLAWIVAIGTGIGILAIFLLLRRDRRRLHEMEQQRLSKKRERRARGLVPMPSPPVPGPAQKATPAEPGS